MILIFMSILLILQSCDAISPPSVDASAKEEKIIFTDVEPDTLTKQMFCFEDNQQTTLSATNNKLLYKWWHNLEPDIKYKVENKQLLVHIASNKSMLNNDSYSRRQKVLINALHDWIGRYSEEEGIAEFKYVDLQTEGLIGENCFEIFIIEN